MYCIATFRSLGHFDGGNGAAHVSAVLRFRLKSTLVGTTIAANACLLQVVIDLHCTQLRKVRKKKSSLEAFRIFVVGPIDYAFRVCRWIQTVLRLLGATLSLPFYNANQSPSA